MVQASTRRTGKTDRDRFFLDLAAPDPAENLPDSSAPILIVAAITGFDACKNDPASAIVNIKAPVVLAKAALAAGRRIIFVSTSSVFAGDIPLCNEYDEVRPQAIYSRQKAEAERQLSALPCWPLQGSIVRLTKVLAPSTPPIPVWRDALNRGKQISPFSDMVFAPISLQFASCNLIRIALSDLCGNFHLSGASDITYVEFARRYVEAHNCSEALVVPTTSAQAAVDLSFSRRFGALGMIRTQQLTSIEPQKVGDVVADLLHAEQSLTAAF